MKKLALAAAFLTTTGCANIMQGTNQPVHISAYDIETNDIVSAKCIVKNDEGTLRTKSNRTVIVGRDKDALIVDCQNEKLQGQAVVDGSINAAYVAVDFFLIDLCIISCFVDGLSGAWAEYPAYVEVPMDIKK